MLEKHNPTITFNIFYTYKKEILPAYILKHNLTCEKQTILLMISKEEKEGWLYLALKFLSALLREITSKHHGDSYCLNCLHSFRTKNLTKKYVKVRFLWNCNTFRKG